MLRPALAVLALVLGAALVAAAWFGPLENLTGYRDSPAWVYLAFGAVPAVPGLVLLAVGVRALIRRPR